MTDATSLCLSDHQEPTIDNCSTVNQGAKSQAHKSLEHNPCFKGFVQSIISFKFEQGHNKNNQNTINTSKTLFAVNSTCLSKSMHTLPNSVHLNVQCNTCHVEPIVGVKYCCNCCEQFDICSECYHRMDPDSHSFYPVHKPKHQHRKQLLKTHIHNSLRVR